MRFQAPDLATPSFGHYLQAVKSLLLLGLIYVSPATAMADDSYIIEFHTARKLDSKDPAAAAHMLRSYRGAVAANDTNYSLPAGISVVEMMYQSGKIVDAGKLAHEVITALESQTRQDARTDRGHWLPLFGFLERGLLLEGKIGEAAKTNRVAAGIIRGKSVTLSDDGPAITAEEIPRLPAHLRSPGWRLVEREAELLDIRGRSIEALALLDEAARQIGPDLRRLPQQEQFYAYKLFSSRAMLRDFLGYEEQAIALQRALLDSPPVAAGFTSPLNLHLNLIRNLSQWHGPSQALLDEAAGVANQLRKQSQPRGLDRLLAKMELDLRDSESAEEALRENALTHAGMGHLLEATYARRDSLSAQAKRGAADLDAEYASLLKQLRAQGNKRGEPSIYREYGHYLLDQDRPSEAAEMLAEALRLTRLFGWTLHEPAILGSLFQAQTLAGDSTGASRTHADLAQWLDDHPEAPLARRVNAITYHAAALGSLGKSSEATAALDQARTLAIPLPDFKKRHLAPEYEPLILQPAAVTAVSSSPKPLPLHVHPLAVSSAAAPGKTARTRFSVINSGSINIAGHYEIEGPGAEITSDGKIVSFTAGEAITTLTTHRLIAARDEAELTATVKSGAAVETSSIQIAWRNLGETTTRQSTWDITWNEDATRRIIMDASSLQANPFRATSLFHELATHDTSPHGIHFRMRSPVPLRFEYYESSGDRLLAIDANGNGDFTDTGDLYLSAPGGIAAALIPIDPLLDTLGIEVRIYSTAGESPIQFGPELKLEAEVYRNGAWILEAENILK